MGGSGSKEKALSKIIKSSNEDINEQDLEEIMMNTQFNELELLKLHDKFLELDRNKRGKITNKEFLDIRELKVTPFRTRLLYAFPLKSDEEVKVAENLRAETLKIDDYKDLEDMLEGNNIKARDNNTATGMEDAKRNSRGDNRRFDDEEKDGGEDEKDDHSKIDDSSSEINNKNKNDDERNRDEEKDAQSEVDQIVDNEEFLRSMGKEAYINFAEF